MFIWKLGWPALRDNLVSEIWLCSSCRSENDPVFIWTSRFALLIRFRLEEVRSCLITRMKISSDKYPQVCWPVCWDEEMQGSEMQLQAIFSNCQNYKIVLASMVEFSHKHKTNLSRSLDKAVS